MKLAPGLHRVGNDIVAVYLVDAPAGVTVIDAGLAGQWKEFLAELDAMGRSLDDVRGVVLTHGDSDHIGFAERLRRDHGVPVYVHEADAARARGEESTKPAWGHVKLGATARFLWYAVRKNGLKVHACITPIDDVGTSEITTIEAIGATAAGAKIQKAWLDREVPQCGYCQSGQIMSAAALLASNPHPTDSDIDDAMSGNVCRCGTYVRIRDAIKQAAAS